MLRRCVEAWELACVNGDRSNRCKVDLSEVTARYVLEGETATENIIAGSTPLRSSATFELFAVNHTRISVPFTLLVLSHPKYCEGYYSYILTCSN